MPVVGHSLDRRLVGVRRLRAQAAAAGAQRGRFRADDVEIFVLGQVEVPAAADLPQLALAEHPAGVGQHAAGKRAFQRRRQTHRPGVEIVAQQHARFVVPPGVDGFQMTPQRGLVEHVVVDERRGVDHFHDRGEHDMLAGRSARRRGPSEAPAPAAAACRRAGNRASPADRRTRCRSKRHPSTAFRSAPTRRGRVRRICCNSSGAVGRITLVGFINDLSGLVPAQADAPARPSEVRTNRPLRPPDFSSKTISSITMPRSTALHMS